MSLEKKTFSKCVLSYDFSKMLGQVENPQLIGPPIFGLPCILRTNRRWMKLEAF